MNEVNEDPENVEPEDEDNSGEEDNVLISNDLNDQAVDALEKVWCLSFSLNSVKLVSLPKR